MDAKTSNPNTWGSYEEALAAASLDINGFHRVGFVFTARDHYCGVDIDNCIDPDTGEVEPSAVEIVELLDSYTEVSPSGTGLKIWVKASKHGDRCRTGNIEMYDSGRFFTFTGRQYGENGIESRQDELNKLYIQLFGKPKAELHGGVKDGKGFTGDDQQLLLKMRNSGDFKLFRRLYDEGVWSGFKSQSEADVRLLGMLAYWTGRDSERMERLFMGSGLARNLDRKSNPDDYLDRSITRAVKECNNTYDPDYGKKARPKVREMLKPCMDFVLSDSWTGRSGPSDRDVYKGLINTGFEYGKILEDRGVEVAASLRNLSLAAGISRVNTVADALKRLEAKGLIEKLQYSGPQTAATYIILVDSKLLHKTTCKYYVSGLSQTQRIRNSSLSVGTIGKRNAQILDHVHCLDRVVTLEEIAKYLKTRKNNLKKRNMPTLLDVGFLEEKDGGYVTPDDIEDRLRRFLEESGSLKAEKLQREKYERERRAYEYYRNGTTAPAVEAKVVPIKPVSIEEDSPEYVPVANEEGTVA